MPYVFIDSEIGWISVKWHTRWYTETECGGFSTVYDTDYITLLYKVWKRHLNFSPGFTFNKLCDFFMYIIIIFKNIFKAALWAGSSTIKVMKTVNMKMSAPPTRKARPGDIAPPFSLQGNISIYVPNECGMCPFPIVVWKMNYMPQNDYSSLQL